MPYSYSLKYIPPITILMSTQCIIRHQPYKTSCQNNLLTAELLLIGWKKSEWKRILIHSNILYCRQTRLRKLNWELMRIPSSNLKSQLRLWGSLQTTGWLSVTVSIPAALKLHDNLMPLLEFRIVLIRNPKISFIMVLSARCCRTFVERPIIINGKRLKSDRIEFFMIYVNFHMENH